MTTSLKKYMFVLKKRSRLLENTCCRFAIFTITVLVMAFGSYDSAYAEMRTRQCDSVLNMAEIEFHSKLIVNTVKDKDRQLCKFYVYMPPSLSQGTAITNMAAKYSNLYGARDAEATVNALQEGFQFDLINALLGSEPNHPIECEQDT